MSAATVSLAAWGSGAGCNAMYARVVLAGLGDVRGTPWAAVRQAAVRQVNATELAASATIQPGPAAFLLVTVLSVAIVGVLAAARAARAERRRVIAAREAQLANSLRASEAAARGLVKHAPYGICRVTPAGQFTEVNPALVAMLTYPDAATLLRADLSDLYLDPAARARILGRHAAGEAMVAGIETVWRRADGRELPVRLHSREVRDAHGTIGYYEAYVTDLGALRRAEQALRQAEKLAAVGQFVSGVAHELNNPLSAVLLFADDLLDDADRSADDREALTLVREQALRARAIVRDLLAFVRGASGATATVSARAVLDAAARALTPQVAATGGQLDVAFETDLGWVRVDRAGVEQVVTNLVLNAVQAAPGGTAATRSGASLCIAVDDDGPGIAPDVLDRMFEPFFTTKAVGQGTGLGLSVSLGIVERLGGTLRAENRVPPDLPGATLTVTLPLAPHPAELGALAADASTTAAAEWPTLAAAAVTAATRAQHATSAAGRAPRLLVVDDEAPIRQALGRFFDRRGWAVDAVDDGHAAITRLLEADASAMPYDLVLSDVRMAGMSGIVLHDWLARTHPALLDRLVFATGDMASPESAAFVQRTRCLVLDKPFEVEALETLARHTVAGHPLPTTVDADPSVQRANTA